VEHSLHWYIPASLSCALSNVRLTLPSALDDTWCVAAYWRVTCCPVKMVSGIEYLYSPGNPVATKKGKKTNTQT